MVVQKLNWNFLALRNEIELKFGQYMFWGNYICGSYINRDTLHGREPGKMLKCGVASLQQVTSMKKTLLFFQATKLIVSLYL